jgi:hypothetical protein
MLKVNTEQKEFVFNFEPLVKNIGIKMSGGTDSSIIAYMLSLYKKKYRPDLNLHVITMDHPLKAFQVKFAKQVMSWLENEFDFKFSSHTTGVGTANGHYADEQLVLLEKSYRDNQLDAHLMGQTTNPIDYQENPKLVELWDWRSEERDIEMKGKLEGTSFVNSEYEEWQKQDIIHRGHYPLLHVDKKTVAELYSHFDIIDTLFPLTRSCEQETSDFSQHCGDCWWCAERQYGFGRLI